MWHLIKKEMKANTCRIRLKKKKKRVLSPLLHRLYFYISTAKVEPYRRGAFVVQLYPSIPPSACYSLLKWLKEFLAVTTRIPWAHPSLQRWSAPYLHSTKPVQGGTLSKPIIALLFCIASSFFFFFLLHYQSWMKLFWLCFIVIFLMGDEKEQQPGLTSTPTYGGDAREVALTLLLLPVCNC